MIAAATQNHRSRQSSLVAQPVIRLEREIGDTPRAKELRCAALGSRFLRNRFDAVFAILIERAIVIRIGPCATWAVDSVKLIEARKSGNAAHEPRFFEGHFGGLENRLQSGCDSWRGSNANAISLDGRLSMWNSAAAIAGRLGELGGVIDSRFVFCHNPPARRRPVY